jgi:hypothetical protein
VVLRLVPVDRRRVHTGRLARAPGARNGATWPRSPGRPIRAGGWPGTYTASPRTQTAATGPPAG